MKKTSHRILFFGNERLATGVTTSAPVLQALCEAGYDVAALVIAQNETGSSRQKHRLEIVELAEKHAIEVLSPVRLSEAVGQLAAYQAEAAVLVAYGKIVPQAVIDIFPGGIINLHPSLLPKHRGSTPIESVILEGAATTGVSLMSLVAAMDAGPIYAQQHVDMTGQETKQDLADKLSMVGRDMIIQHLPAILGGQAQPKPQNEAEATTDRQISKSDGGLDWQKPAERLEREIRAYGGWPRSRGQLAGTEIIITRAHVINGHGEAGSVWHEGQQFGFFTPENILVIDRLIPAGKPEMSAAAFLAGYKVF